MADTLLVTGANGFVALHVIKDAITQGYKVVGTVRSIAAAEKIMKVFPHSSSQLQIIEVHDITKANNFEMAFRKFKIGAVINTASPLVNSQRTLRPMFLILPSKAAWQFLRLQPNMLGHG
ncbi:hypothetical protein FP744_10003317 [Trichoderma asperellum]